MKRDSDLGSAHRRWSPSPRVCVVVTTVLAVLAGGVGVSDAVVDSGPDYRSVSVVSATDNVTVSWQIRSGGTVRLRLYRLRPDGGATLVTETMAHGGVSSFEVVDYDRPPGTTVYYLRLVQASDLETTLGFAVCVESQFSQCSIPVTSTVSHHSVRATERDDWLRILSWPFATVESVTKSGWIRGPDPPVPRRA